jgi:hypothetical protein
MTRTAGRVRRLIVAIGGVVISTLGVAPAARADSCSAVGKFTVTVPAGTGFLSLSADGTVEMSLVLGGTRTLRGTYFTAVLDQGCYFQMELATPPPTATTDTIVGMVAFEGRQLVFAASTSPDFASGPALRNDALTGTLSVAAAARANSCSAVGKFTVTVVGGTGFLSLSADGTFEMSLVLGHTICPTCPGFAPRTVRGTYRTFAYADGCGFQMQHEIFPELAAIVGDVSFEGRQLLFTESLYPDFASGLALRNDALTGR